MLTEFKALLYKKPIAEKLLSFGFTLQNGLYTYSEDIQNGQIRLTASTDGKNAFGIKAWDIFAEEEYYPAYAKDAVGPFVGGVKAAAENMASRIAEKCFVTDAFEQPQTKAVIQYADETYGTPVEFLWDDTPDCGVLRNKTNRKWYGTLMRVKNRSLGLNGNGEKSTEVINLKAPPSQVAELLGAGKVLKAYHMNKKHWYTLPLNDSLPLSEIYDLIDISYNAISKKTKKSSG